VDGARWVLGDEPGVLLEAAEEFGYGAYVWGTEEDGGGDSWVRIALRWCPVWCRQRRGDRIIAIPRTAGLPEGTHQLAEIPDRIRL
jgi:hypothetical protein